MPLMKLSDTVIELFAKAPEVQMDVQIGVTPGAEYFLVVGSQVAVKFDTKLRQQLRDLRERSWMAPDVAHDARVKDFRRWHSDLPEGPDLEPATEVEDGRKVEDPHAVLGLIFHGPVGPLPLPPPRPAYVYGHLQFYGDTEPDDIFYRYEYFPTSKRIFQNSTPPSIAKDTYAAPASEAQFAPSGFGAVARFALPTLTPARWRWELQPVPKSRIKMGASVPLYGQAGGGVEVMFEHDTDNRGPIANQVVLPIL